MTAVVIRLTEITVGREAARRCNVGDRDQYPETDRSVRLQLFFLFVQQDGRRSASWEMVAMTADGIITLQSAYGPKKTLDRLAAAVAAHGMTIFARIDHAGAASDVDMELRPTELLVFGNARAGTPLMQSSQLIGIDLPLRALAWQDESQASWLSYVDPAWLANRFGIAATAQTSIDRMIAVLRLVTAEATTPAG